MSGYLYVMQHADGRVKLGYSKDPAVRRSQLGRDVQLIWQTIKPRSDAYFVEAETLCALSPFRNQWEWFWVEPEQAIRAVLYTLRRADAGERLLSHRPSEHGANAPPRGGWTKDQALAHGEEYLRQCAKRARRREPGQKILDGLGLERVVSYRQAPRRKA